MPMLTDELLKKLDGISDGSVKGYPVRNLYRLMYTPELWMVAYSNLQSNKGAITKGVNEDTVDLNGARKLRRSFGLMKKQWFTDTIQLRNRCPLRQSTFHLPAAYPRIDLTSLVQMDPQRLGIPGRLSLAYHR